ncbi:caspase-8-like isoform X2 [Ptychodera flava]|uniref:caspase-8-like isoform X2 n=1 Tax=Ptychodera flava TaxID=63121 RepID=UPI00396A8CF1
MTVTHFCSFLGHLNRNKARHFRAEVVAGNRMQINSDDTKEFNGVHGESSREAVNGSPGLDEYGYHLHRGETAFSALLRKSRKKGSVSYKMYSRPHGFAVIIANEHFNKDSDNPGSVQLEERPHVKTEVECLRGVFQRLGYLVCVYLDLTSEQLINKSELYCRKDHKAYDSFICCILSRGTSTHVYGSDGIAISLQEFIANFNGRRAPSLSYKPKIFFTETYKGPTVSASNTLVRTETIQVSFAGYCLNPDNPCEITMNAECRDSGAILPDDFDYLLANCTYKGKVDPEIRSLFMMMLADRLDGWSPYTHIETILDRLKRDLKRQKMEGCRVNVSVESTLRKSLSWTNS